MQFQVSSNPPFSCTESQEADERRQPITAFVKAISAPRTPSHTSQDSLSIQRCTCPFPGPLHLAPDLCLYPVDQLGLSPVRNNPLRQGKAKTELTITVSSGRLEGGTPVHTLTLSSAARLLLGPFPSQKPYEIPLIFALFYRNKRRERGRPCPEHLLCTQQPGVLLPTAPSSSNRGPPAVSMSMSCGGLAY